MKIAIGADHAGFQVKRELLDVLTKWGYKVMDVGTHSEERADYPDYAKKVALIVTQRQADKGLLVCGTGIGMAIAANKVPGVRAGVAWNKKTAELAAEHNGLNVLCLPARHLPLKQMQAIIKAWLTTPFGGGRHLRRIKKIAQIEKELCRPEK